MVMMHVILVTQKHAQLMHIHNFRIPCFKEDRGQIQSNRTGATVVDQPTPGHKPRVNRGVIQKEYQEYLVD